MLLRCAVQAFAKGVGPFLEAVQEHDFLHATKLTLMLAAIAVPLNTVFGTVAAILITRNEFPGKVGSRCAQGAAGLSSLSTWFDYALGFRGISYGRVCYT
jgi:hypothetical protein